MRGWLWVPGGEGWFFSRILHTAKLCSRRGGGHLGRPAARVWPASYGSTVRGAHACGFVPATRLESSVFSVPSLYLAAGLLADWLRVLTWLTGRLATTD